MNKALKYLVVAAAGLLLAIIASYTYKFIMPQSEEAFASSDPTEKYPLYSEEAFEITGTEAQRKTVRFEDGGTFEIYRFNFTEQSKKQNLFTYELSVRGKLKSIKWQNYDDNGSIWVSASTVYNVPKATLFIETEEESMLLSVPALYYDKFDHKTIEFIPDLEMPAKLEEASGGLKITMEFAASEGAIGELWYFKSENKLTEWNEQTESLLIRQNLHKNRRFCYDGYYFPLYTNYTPYSENGLFRNAANYTGAQMLESDILGSLTDVGYAMTKICAENQNENGYWETGPMSQWLNNDYGIGFDFYDTRFSTDFAVNLLSAYKKYNDIQLLEKAERYAEFLITYAEEYGYKVGNGFNTGILVPDYYEKNQTKTPHASLNHHLSETNFLLEMYLTTGKEKYKASAKKLLRGVEITCSDWIQKDGNLKYALMYTESSNVMIDYPYLTYNDLYDTNALLQKIGMKSEEIELLMQTKKSWMDTNGISGYKGSL